MWRAKKFPLVRERGVEGGGSSSCGSSCGNGGISRVPPNGCPMAGTDVCPYPVWPRCWASHVDSVCPTLTGFCPSSLGQEAAQQNWDSIKWERTEAAQILQLLSLQAMEASSTWEACCRICFSSLPSPANSARGPCQPQGVLTSLPGLPGTSWEPGPGAVPKVLCEHLQG